MRSSSDGINLGRGEVARIDTHQISIRCIANLPMDNSLPTWIVHVTQAHPSHPPGPVVNFEIWTDCAGFGPAVDFGQDESRSDLFLVSRVP